MRTIAAVKLFIPPPLIEEIEIINRSGLQDVVIIIDDARYVAGRVNGVRYAEYPEFIAALTQTDRYISCIHDFFIAAPRALAGAVDALSSAVERELLAASNALGANKFLHQ